MSIEIRNASLTLGNKHLLNNVSLDFNPKEMTILLGPNGTGKSSLLKLLSREWKTEGALSFYGKPSSHWRDDLLAKSMGVLPQYSSLSFAFTVREVVELGGLTLALSQKEITEIAEEKMQDTDVLHLVERPYPTLSGGEKQRVHFARVLTQIAASPRPPILLLDEPTSALDIRHQHHTLQVAKQLAYQGATVIAVVHDLNLAARYADRILMLHSGAIIADGSPLKVLTSKNIEDVYGWPVEILMHPLYQYPVILS